jgi:hypothetical protein
MKAAILAEMALLLGGSLLTKAAQGTSWEQLFLGGGLTKTALAVVLLLAILLTLEELGAGSVAVGFGGLIVLGYFLAASGSLGQNVLAIEQSFFGTSQTTPPGPSQSTGDVTNPVKSH